MTLGPILILDALDGASMTLSALFIAPRDAPPPPVEAPDGAHQPEPILTVDDQCVWRARFACQADAPSYYRWNGARYDLASDLRGDLRLAYVSCNGEEHGDLDRDPAERNALWDRLAERHAKTPFALLIHGGDQVYADEATKGHPLTEGWPDTIPDAPGADDLAALRQHLRRRFFERYRALYEAPGFGRLAARVPSLMQWDDHDICDGWGSLPRRVTRSAVGQTLFDVAREMALALQHGTTDGDLPARFADASGGHLGWRIDAPGFRLVAPDLRSERTRREVMGRRGWAMMEAAATPFDGHSFLVSSVPLLGPRLSVLEAVMVALPSMQKYEDDLRDQWQSRAHRDSWRRMLRLSERMGAAGPITAISGEIHLATRAEMALPDGGTLHQLVASGITHRPPPRSWARFLGLLSRFGESPLRGHPIRIRPLPGQRRPYVAQRNALILARDDDAWSARWDLETDGLSPPLPLGPPRAPGADRLRDGTGSAARLDAADATPTGTVAEPPNAAETAAR